MTIYNIYRLPADLICGESVYIVIELSGSVQLVDHETGAELRLKPGSLRGHDVAGVGDVDELIHGDGVEGEGHLHLAAVDTTFQFAKTTDTADEVDALVAAQVGDAEDVAQYEIGGDSHIEHADRILVVIGTLLGSE